LKPFDIQICPEFWHIISTVEGEDSSKKGTPLRLLQDPGYAQYSSSELVGERELMFRCGLYPNLRNGLSSLTWRIIHL
jgi:hypothetical protein